MSKIVRMTSDDPISAEAIEELKRVANMPPSEIRTDLIPEHRFDVALAIKRRKEGWTPGKVAQKKAS